VGDAIAPQSAPDYGIRVCERVANDMAAERQVRVELGQLGLNLLQIERLEQFGARLPLGDLGVHGGFEVRKDSQAMGSPEDVVGENVWTRWGNVRVGLAGTAMTERGFGMMALERRPSGQLQYLTSRSDCCSDYNVLRTFSLTYIHGILQ